LLHNAEKLAQERDAHAKLATERQAQLEQAVQAKAGQEKLIAERLSQIHGIMYQTHTAIYSMT